MHGTVALRDRSCGIASRKKLLTGLCTAQIPASYYSHALFVVSVLYYLPMYILISVEFCLFVPCVLRFADDAWFSSAVYLKWCVQTKKLSVRFYNIPFSLTSGTYSGELTLYFQHPSPTSRHPSWSEGPSKVKNDNLIWISLVLRNDGDKL
jgi:hypothetical protein